MKDLKVNQVSVKYKEHFGIKDAFVEVQKGEIVGFIGADGAGKSSLMHAISGVIKFSGEITYQNYTYHSPKEAEKIKDKLGFMPQGIGLVLYDDLSVNEHLDFFSDIRNLKKDKEYQEYRQRLLKMAGLSEFTNRLAKNLSGGMKQKLSLICTLIHKPKLLLLDEPTTGVDPISRQELWNILDENRKKEQSISIVSTAYMSEAGKMDRLYLFDDGEIIANGTKKKLLDMAKDYTYYQTECQECITFNKKTYSLKPLKSKKAPPSLESIFFVNALKKGKIPPPIEISFREKDIDIPQTIMEAKGLTKRFKDFIANDHIDLKLNKGEIVGLLGANGAGKTTFIKMLLGLYPIDEGELYLLGKKIKSAKDRQQLKSKIGYMSQLFALYKDLTIYENLIYFANMYGLDMQQALKKIEKLSKGLGFNKYLHSFPKELPLGIKQRFSLAAAIMHEPVVLFLDEPTSGVDTVARAQFWKLLHQLKKKWKISILITTHYMSEAEYCDRVVVLKRGKKIADNTPDELFKKYPDAKIFEEVFLKLYKDKE